jgi:hypothetical protein
MINQKELKKLELFGALRLLVFGYIFEDGEIDEALDILDEFQNQIKEEVKKELKSITK